MNYVEFEVGEYWYRVAIDHACRCVLAKRVEEADNLFDHLDAIRWANSHESQTGLKS